MDILLIHCLGLLWLSFGAARRLTSHPADQFLTAALLGWGNLVATSLLLSIVGRLGEPLGVLILSLSLGGMTCLLATRLPGEPAAPHAPSEPPQRLLLIAFWLGVAALAVGHLAAACAYLPGAPDALTWQIPRALYYIGQGNLAHFDAADPRQTVLPFNHTLLQLPVLVYGAPLQCLNVGNVVAWAVAGVGVHRFCRLVSLGANASLVACWLALTLPPATAQAASVTPELPAGAALMAGLVFAAHWQKKKEARYAVLAALAVALAAGSSLAVFLGGLAALLILWIRARGHLKLPARTWLPPAVVAGTLLLPFVLINFAANPGWIGSYLRFAAQYSRTGSIVPGGSGWWPLPATPSPLQGLSEDVVSVGLPGLLCLFAALFSIRRHSGTAISIRWLAAFGLAWFAVIVVLQSSGYGTCRAYLPVMLVLSPSLAALVASIDRASPAPRRLVRGLMAVTAVTAGWSAAIYLLRNNDRPLLPLLNATMDLRGMPRLPLLVEYHLSGPARINVDTDGINERIFPFMAQGRHQRFTSRHEIEPTAYNLLSRYAGSRNAAFLEPDGLPSYTLIPLPGKPTAGVEFLGTVGLGASARDYFGIEAQAGRTTPVASNRNLLVTLSHERVRPGQPAAIQLRLAGLNTEDQARLTVYRQAADHTLTPLAVFDRDGTARATLAGPFHQLLFRVVTTGTEVEMGATAIPYEPSPDRNQPPLDKSLPTGKNSLFVTDVILARNPSPLVVEGLLPVEGPFPQWDLPYVRWQREPTARITLPSPGQISRLQLSFSVRLQVRRKAALDVKFNGQVVQHYRIENYTAWLDQTLELTPQPGANVLEFSDAPLNDEPDWQDYLERYPDVKKHLATNRLPLEEGAREHYETRGKAEGRTVRLTPKPEPAPDGYYFMYRDIRLEGFRTP